MLPTLADAKSYCRIDTTDEDALVGQLLLRAQALIERELGYPITAVQLSYIDYSDFDNYGLVPTLRLPGPFELAAPAPIVTDVNGVVVDATTYYLDSRRMQILAKAGIRFDVRPYTIVATVGLSKHPDYAATLELIVSVSILDLVSHLYLNRNPAQSSETDEGGGAKTLEGGLSPSLLPARVMDSINLLPGRMGGMLLA